MFKNNLKVKNRNKNLENSLNKITSCVVKNEQPLESISEEIKNVIIDGLNSQNKEQFLSEYMNNLKINKGRFALLMAEKAILPSYATQDLAKKIELTDCYVTSSYQRDFGSVPNLNLFVLEKEHGFSFGVDKEYNFQVLKYLSKKSQNKFRLIPVQSGDLYVLHNDFSGKNLALNEDGYLSLNNPNFDNNELFYIYLKNNSIKIQSAQGFGSVSQNYDYALDSTSWEFK